MTQITPAQQLFDLGGEVALVTGASSGLGRRFARVLAAHGAKVVAAARRIAPLEALQREFPAVSPLPFDVTRADGIAAALAEAERLAGPLTLLVNNAGIGGGRRILETAAAEWEAVQRTNVDAVWHLSRAFAQRLIAREARGAIINIASIAASKVGVTSAAYAVSKAAILHMTRAQAAEWARHGIRVNAIAPGYIHSEMTEAYLASPAGQEMASRLPLRRAGDESDLDGALLLLASPRASGFMTGQAVTVDGGHLLI